MFQLMILAALVVGVADRPYLVAQAPSAKSPAKSDSKAAKAAPAASKGEDGTEGSKQGEQPAAEGDAKAGEGDEGAATAEGEDAAGAEGQSEDTTPAEKTDAPPGKSIWESGALGYMIAGGFFMWPLLFLGILSAGAIIERFRSLKLLRTDTAALRERVGDLLRNDRVEEAYELCDSQQGPVPAILAVGLRKFLVLRRLNYDPAKIEEQVVKAMDDYGVHIVAALERHLPILATVSSVAPMLGFLGTVQGMVISFQDIVAKINEVNIVEAAAEGIMVSLLTTVLGLIIGIPSFMAFNYFTGVINGFVLQVEESASELIEVVTLQMTLEKSDSEEPTVSPAYQD